MNFSSLTLDQILKTYALPHRLLAYFASQCAKDALSRTKDPDPRSMLAVDVAERFGNGEDFSQEYLDKVYGDSTAAAATSASYATRATASAAASASYATRAAAAAATSAAHAASDAVHAATAAHAASDAVHAARAAAYPDYPANAVSYKDLLIKLIDQRLTPLEKLLILW